MKRIPYPKVDDDATITAMAVNPALASYPRLRAPLPSLLAQYEAYMRANGNPLVVDAPKPLKLSTRVKDALRKHYASPPALLAFLADIRDRGSPDVCPMCGSLKTGTLDHIFPKNIFAEFAIFSRNLVPACDCNSLRRESYKGDGAGERVLHPYFDAVMNQRLLRAGLSSSSGSFQKPIIGLNICIPAGSPFFAAVNYHLENVVLRTQIIEYLECFWPKILRFYSDYFRLPDGNFTRPQLDHAVDEALAVFDRRRSTPNNWDSMLFAGLAVNIQAKTYLEQTIRNLRSGALRPEDI